MEQQKVDRDIIRQAVQDAGYRAWENKGRRGTVVMATGVGKSKLAVRRCIEILEEPVALLSLDQSPDILLVTPTEKLRDENWPAEFSKWGATDCLKWVKRICFASLKQEKGNQYRLVILDEIHRLTPLNAQGFLKDNSLTEFFADNVAEEVMGLTATEPDFKEERIKYDIINSIAPVCFRYTLDQAVDDGVLPPYKIKVIMVPLDPVTKCIPGGTQKKPFLTTEVAAYAYLNKLVMKAQFSKNANWAKTMYAKRMRFIAELPSKTRVARKVMERVLPGQKVIIFCGSIEQSRQLCGDNVYNSSPEDKTRNMLQAFKDDLIDYLGVVNAVNEGHNIPGITKGIIVQLNSNDRDITQRLGRVMRGEEPEVYIIVSQGTKDQDWARKALEDFDKKRIVYESYLSYL